MLFGACGAASEIPPTERRVPNLRNYRISILYASSIGRDSVWRAVQLGRLPAKR